MSKIKGSKSQCKKSEQAFNFYRQIKSTFLFGLFIQNISQGGKNVAKSYAEGAVEGLERISSEATAE